MIKPSLSKKILKGVGASLVLLFFAFFNLSPAADATIKTCPRKTRSERVKSVRQRARETGRQEKSYCRRRGQGRRPAPSGRGSSSGPAISVVRGAHTYGPGLQMASLQETGIGKYSSNLRPDIRFRADQDGQIVSVMPYIIWTKPSRGYSAGTGGRIKVELRTDGPDHFPSEAVLATGYDNNPMNGYFPVIRFSSPGKVKKGGLYHLVFTNVDPDPAANWVSIDSLLAVAPGERVPTDPRQPGLSDDLAVIYGTREANSWRLRPGETPIFQVAYADGHKQGQGYMESMIRNAHAISGQAAVREVFTVRDANRKVASLAIRLKRLNGRGALDVRLETGGGSVLEDASIPAASIPTEDGWINVPFKGPRVLSVGGSYRIILTAPADTTYSIYSVDKGSHYGFDPATYFHDGHAEFTTGSGWTGWTKKSGGVVVERNVLSTDLQFYFNCE